MGELRFAIVGAGFWAGYQLAAWNEVSGARCVAVCNRTRATAESLASAWRVPAVYDDLALMLGRERLDFVDVITSVESHAGIVSLVARHRLPVICQKPMAPSLREAEELVALCQKTGRPFLIHENWRWQRPLRELKRALDSGAIGSVFRARIDYCNSFPVFDNQPFLKELERFILTDMGTHLLDTARFLFGEARQLYCQTQRVHPEIRGEDVATVMLRMETGATVTCNMSYASRLEQDRFPETFVLAEGAAGSVELAPDFWIRVTTSNGTMARRCPPPSYAWADSRYALVHASIVDCHRDLLRALRGEGRAETTAEDNLHTLRLVFGAYQSAREARPLDLNGS
jgi:predicted dehydrogenase